MQALLLQQQQYLYQHFQQQQLRATDSPCSGGTPANGMSTLWLGCREFLRNVAFGSQCRSLFSLEPNTCFLNHNAYGTAVKPVLQAQAHFANQMESNPDRFVRREAPAALRQAASKLAQYLHAEPEDVVFVTNATTGMNAVLQSLDLQEGDEVLCLNLTCTSTITHSGARERSRGTRRNRLMCVTCDV